MYITSSFYIYCIYFACASNLFLKAPFNFVQWTADRETRLRERD